MQTMTDFNAYKTKGNTQFKFFAEYNVFLTTFIPEKND